MWLGRTWGNGSKHKLQCQCLIAVKRERWRDTEKEVKEMEGTIKRPVKRGKTKRLGEKERERVGEGSDT